MINSFNTIGVWKQAAFTFFEVFIRGLRFLQIERGSVTFAKIERGCAYRTSEIDFLYIKFSPNYPPTHQYTIFDRKAPNFAQIG